MKIFWIIVLVACWTIGTGMTYWEVLADDDIRNKIMAEFQLLADTSFIFMILYCLIIAIVCALWPVWKIGDIVTIFSKKGEASK